MASPLGRGCWSGRIIAPLSACVRVLHHNGDIGIYVLRAGPRHQHPQLGGGGRRRKRMGDNSSKLYQSCPWVGLTRGLGWVGLGWVGNGSKICVLSGLGWVMGLK